MARLDAPGAEGLFVDVAHLGLVQRHQAAVHQLRQQLAGGFRVDRIDGGVHLAARRHAQHRHVILAERIDQIPGGAVTAGEQQQLRAGIDQSARGAAGVIGFAGRRRLAERTRRQPGRPTTVLAHGAAPGEHLQTTDARGQTGQGAGHAVHRHGRGAAPQRFLAGVAAVTALEAHGAADAGERVDQHAQDQAILDVCHKTIMSLYNNGRDATPETLA